MAPPATRKRSENRKPPRAIEYGILPDLLGYHLRRAQVSVFQNFAEWLGDNGLTPGRLGVLTLIDANPGLNQTELGNAMGIARSTVVSVIDRLESRGQVVRAPSPTDRRSYALRLSAKGKALLAEIAPTLRAHERQIAADLSAAERRTLVALLRRIGGY